MLDVLPMETLARRRELFLQYLDALGALGRFQEVRDLLESGPFRLDPVSEHMYLATAKAQLGQVAATDNEWQRALEAADSPDKCLSLSAYAEHAGAMEVADSGYQKAISIAPNIRAAYDGRARIARAGGGRTAEAREISREVCRLGPTTDARSEQLYLSLLLDASTEDAERAVPQAEVLVMREPSNWQARHPSACTAAAHSSGSGAASVFRGQSDGRVAGGSSGSSRRRT